LILRFFFLNKALARGSDHTEDHSQTEVVRILFRNLESKLVSCLFKSVANIFILVEALAGELQLNDVEEVRLVHFADYKEIVLKGNDRSTVESWVHGHEKTVFFLRTGLAEGVEILKHLGANFGGDSIEFVKDAPGPTSSHRFNNITEVCSCELIATFDHDDPSSELLAKVFDSLGFTAARRSKRGMGLFGFQCLTVG